MQLAFHALGSHYIHPIVLSTSYEKFHLLDFKATKKTSKDDLKKEKIQV